MLMIGWEGVTDSLDDRRVRDCSMSDDSGLDLYGWGWRRGLTRCRSWGNSLRGRGSRRGGCGQDSSDGQGGVLD